MTTTIIKAKLQTDVERIESKKNFAFKALNVDCLFFQKSWFGSKPYITLCNKFFQFISVELKIANQPTNTKKIKLNSV